MNPRSVSRKTLQSEKRERSTETADIRDGEAFQCKYELFAVEPAAFLCLEAFSHFDKLLKTF